MEIHIRKAAPADAPLISQIMCASWKQAYKGMIAQSYLDNLPEDHWVEPMGNWLREGSHEIAVGEADGTAAGVAAYGPAHDSEWNGWGELTAIYLLPGHIGRGLGRTLMDHALQGLRSMGYDRCVLYVLRENVRAKAFYASAGFEYSGRDKHIELAGQPIIDEIYTRIL